MLVDKIGKLWPAKFGAGLLDQLVPTTTTNDAVYRRMAIRILIRVEPLLSFFEQEILPELEAESDFKTYEQYLVEKRALKEKKVKEHA